ncbi:MAG: transcriptional regulator, effector-binding domain/component [Chthonomonadaceae bacterium]|nr:transcriptional regulator, effector-binding domain/component [Chthonomonadaceae bacterium]
MLKIGEFSRLSQVSVKTLRFYDDQGLLRPCHVDSFTGYRYYEARQLPRLIRILALKDLGFTLEQIAPVLEEGVTPEEIRGMLRLKRSEIEQRIEQEQERLTRVATRLQQMEQEETMSNYDVIIKPVAAQRIASVRQVLPHYSAIGALLNEVYQYLGSHGVAPIGPCLALWHDTEYKEQDVDGEGCVPLAAATKLEGNDRVRISEMPAVESVAALVHHGSYQNLSKAYEALFTWIEANGYHVVGTNRELYLQSGGDGRQDDDTCVTEIQFPVARNA